MNMYSTGSRKEDELLRLLRQGLITPEQARDVGQDYGSLSIADFANLGAFAPETQRRSGRAAVRDAELQQRANATPIEDAIVRGTSRGGRAIGSKPGLLDVGMTQKQGRVGRGRNEALTFGGRQTVEQGLDGSLGAFPGEKDEPEYRERLGDADPIAKRTFEKQDMESSLRDSVAGMDTTQRRSTDPRARLSTERAEEGEISPVSEGVEVGLLSRIGKAITDNPELAASGAQLLGGLISNAAQNRAQRRADRTNRERTGRANLISALTGGRVRPDVERAQADTGGFMSLDTLGKALQGGGAAYKGELARQVEEAERERKARLEERGMRASELGVKSLDDYRKATLAFNKKKFDKETQLAAEQNVVDYLKAAKDLNESERIPIKEIGELSSELASLKRLDNLEDFIIDADFSFLEMGPLRLEEPSQFIFGSDARVAESAIQGLIAEVAKTIPGVLTEGDQKRLETRLLSLNDTESTALDVAQAFREELLVKFEERLGALRESGGFDTTYFDDRLMEYRQGRGAQGFESMLTKDEIVLGG